MHTTNAYTHIKSRVEAAPEVELFLYILDNTRGCYYFSTTLIKEEPYAEIILTSATTTLLLFCVYIGKVLNLIDPWRLVKLMKLWKTVVSTCHFKLC